MNLKHVNGFSSIKVHQNDVQHALLVSAVTITVGSTFFFDGQVAKFIGKFGTKPQTSQFRCQ